MSENKTTEKEEPNEYIHSKSDRSIILNFKWEDNTVFFEENKYILLRFQINAEYVRLDTKNLDYLMEIKFKI